ncbi:helix-turn-helix transcriptional regulator [Bacillus solimangrovi]|uniref:Transcriptional regulator n=1 Tax=Bacillus solimangrovi TaxID=1305675 RepID=A0A1E5LHK1_9BACI|nr:YafY family protein [Bacillus solimangrovi]OEH93559.1 transcriptional regulator [Bacillus solimangrovi]
MRADRLISILLLLQNRGKLTTRELAEQLEVNTRTIHRDMEALSAAGIPVVAVRGKAGGWQLLEQYRTKLTGLKENELVSLFISPSSHLLNDLNLSDEWKEARQKLLASIPISLQEQTSDVWNRIHIDTTTWKQSTEKIESFKILQQAIWNEKKLKIEYEKADGECTQRIVEPLGLVAKGSKWYLVASSNGQYRNYRASRMISVMMTEDTFTRPIDFDLSTYWSNSTQQFIRSLPKYEVVVEASPSIIQRLTFTGRFIQTIKVDSQLENGWIPITMSFDSEQEAREYILGFGNQIKINHPVTLKENIYKMAKSVVQFYEQENEL